jgi:hypothetical protein
MDWDKRAPIFLLGNRDGTAPTSRELKIWLAHDRGRLLLHAQGRDAELTCHSERLPDDPRFWMQDHVEFRLEMVSGEQLQIIVTPDGRYWDSQGVRARAGLLTCAGAIHEDRWSVDLALSCAALGLPTLSPGMVLRGIVAHVRWAGGLPDIVCCSATVLGFQQAERFAEFVIGDHVPALPVVSEFRLVDNRTVGLTLVNMAPIAFAGRSVLTHERADGEAGPQVSPLRIFPDASTTLTAPVELDSRRFTRIRVAIEDERGRRELGAVALLAAVSPLSEPKNPLQHPYMCFDADGLAAFRRKAALPFIQSLAARLAPEPADYDEGHLPPPGGRFTFDFDADSMHWGRVARETMLRDGEGRRRPAAARIWELLPPAAKDAFRQVAGMDTARPDHLAVLLPAFNALLHRRDLYDHEAFAGVRLPPEGVELLARGAGGAGGPPPVATTFYRPGTAGSRRADSSLYRPGTAGSRRADSSLYRPGTAGSRKTDSSLYRPGTAGSRDRDLDGAGGPPPVALTAAHLDDLDLAKFNRILLQSSIECCHKFKVDLAARAGGYLAKWVLSGDSRLVDLATRTAQAAADSMLTEPTFHLHEGNVSPLLALAYDTFYPLLTEEERAHWRRLLTKLLDLYLTSARAGEWTVTAIPNANPVGNAGAGFLALALWQEEPEKAREAIGWIRRYISSWLDYCFGPDGGNTEGCQYWQYGTDSWIRFAALYERFFGGDDGLLDHPALRNGMNMVRVALCNDGALHGVNDTIPVPCGAELAWYWAGRYGDSFALWYGDHAWRWYEQAIMAGRPTPYQTSAFWSILFRPAVPEVIKQPEALPQAFVLHSIECGILRSGPEWNCHWTAGLKGSRPPYTHHNQADTGSFFIDLRGERLLIDPGYYKPEAGDHSLPMIGGIAPEAPSAYTGKLVACESRGDVRYLACDSTEAYRGAARRVVRHLVLVGDEGLILLDDIVPTDSAVELCSLYQCGGETGPIEGGRALLVKGREATLRLDLLTRPDALIELRPERTLHDVHWGYHFAQCRLFPVRATYRADESDPLVSTFMDAKQALSVCRIEREGRELTVVLPSGRRVGFGWCKDGWRFNVESAVSTCHD